MILKEVTALSSIEFVVVGLNSLPSQEKVDIDLRQRSGEYESHISSSQEGPIGRSHRLVKWNSERVVE